MRLNFSSDNPTSRPRAVNHVRFFYTLVWHGLGLGQEYNTACTLFKYEKTDCPYIT